MQADLPLAVVGAGFSGTVTALHLLSRSARPILLCERGERFARGTAFGTDDPGHLLNVRAANMSAFPDRPSHFADWLESAGHHASPQVCVTAAGTFVSRQLYGTYLAGLLEQAVAGSDGAQRLILVPDEVVDLAPDGNAFRLTLAGGRSHRVAGAVLAAGNMLPARNDGTPYIANPWTAPALDGLDPGRPVVVIGSGLTMVDVVLRLRHAGFTGPVVALSRRGLHPHMHAAAAPWPTPAFTAAERRSPARLLARLRHEAALAAEQGVDWRSVVDSLRPITSGLWRAFDGEAQARFLRHARPWWDIHRHRMAVPVGAQVEGMLREGRLVIRAAQVEAIRVGEDEAEVRIRPRGRTESETIRAQRVVNATGNLPTDRCGHTLIEAMVAAGLARPDRHRLGLDLTEDGALRGADGTPRPGLWALGPLGQGVFWECTAVPDIRTQALRVASTVADLLG